MDDQIRQTPSQRILVTGASGFVGSYLLNRLRGEYQITALKLPNEETDHLGGPYCQWREASLPDSLPSLAGHHEVIHLASMESGPPSKIHAVNVEGTAALLQSCKDNGVQRFLYLSSLDVALGREDPYAETKREAESLVRASSLDWMILRPSVIYGLRGGALLNKLIGLASRGCPVPLPGNGQQLIQPLYVEDLVELIAQLLSNEFGRRVFEVGGPRASSYIEVLELAANLQGKALYTIPIPIQALAPGLLLLGAIWPETPIGWSKLKAVLDSKILDVLPSKNDLGFVPRELVEGLRKMLDGQRA